MKIKINSYLEHFEINIAFLYSAYSIYKNNTNNNVNIISK